jgi:6,7-dimethyl-8-ribityllumazine synthase
MQGANKGTAGELAGAGLRIGIVQARFNQEITNRLAEVCREELLRLEVQDRDITHCTVPGALEVPTSTP